MDIVSLNELIPNIVDEIMLYFAFHPDHPSEDISKKNIATLSQFLQEKYSLDNTSHVKQLVFLCESLCEITSLFCLRRDTQLGYRNCYYWAGAFTNGEYYAKMNYEDRKPFFTMWENAIFGSRYIYNKYKEYVLPIVYTAHDESEGIGTGFVVAEQFIVTARHCLEKAKSISFGKIAYDIYKDAEVFYHTNPNIDIAIVHINPLGKCGFRLSEDCSIFDKVITMGYPKIPGFNCFQTAEEAVISAVPEKRFTVTEGQVAAEAQQIWSRENLFLITAKIKGGNSGGPVVNQFGDCIGIVSNTPFADGGDYDDLGYGTVMPASFAISMITDASFCQPDSSVRFVQYPYDNDN